MTTMMMVAASVLSILLAACLPAWSAEASRERVLVLLDDPTSARQSHAAGQSPRCQHSAIDDHSVGAIPAVMTRIHQ